MRCAVRVRLFTPAGEEVTEGILSNEEDGEKAGCELFVDGARWTGRYDVLGLIAGGAPFKSERKRTLRDIMADMDKAEARGEPYIPGE